MASLILRKNQWGGFKFKYLELSCPLLHNNFGTYPSKVRFERALVIERSETLYVKYWHNSFLMFRFLKFMVQVLFLKRFEQFLFPVPVIDFGENLDLIKTFRVPMREIRFCPNYSAVLIMEVSVNVKPLCVTL